MYNHQNKSKSDSNPSLTIFLEKASKATGKCLMLRLMCWRRAFNTKVWVFVVYFNALLYLYHTQAYHIIRSYQHQVFPLTIENRVTLMKWTDPLCLFYNICINYSRIIKCIINDTQNNNSIFPKLAYVSSTFILKKIFL